MPSRKSRGQRRSVEGENDQIKSEPEPAETQRRPNYDDLPSEFAICDPNSTTPMAPKPPLPATPKTPQNVQKKPEASKKTENKPKNDRAQQERKPPKEMMKKPAKENRQNAKNPAKEAVKKQDDRVKRVESQERKSTEDLIKDLIARNEEIGSLMKIVQGNIPSQKSTEKKLLKQELKNLSHMQDMYAGNCLSIALRLFNAESSSEKTDKHRIDLYRSIGRYKQKSEEKTAEINAAMSKLSVNNKEAETQKMEKQPKKIKKEFNQGSPKNSKTAEKNPDPVKLKPAHKMAVPEPARKEGSGISSNSGPTSESEVTEEQIEAMESDPYLVYDEVDALAGQLSDCDIVHAKQYVEPEPYYSAREVSQEMAKLKLEENAVSVIHDSHLAREMEPSEFTEINDDYCKACEDLGQPCEDCDELSGW
ncbi:Oidioi.mRNA.OKI2018_I69.chr2.g6065.t1.cds [Oikopleura dioica]|uniref:Oidioi.mRNA.OKI2018_I69.chr2.g6065.t1.cds n=1 Tax=Oikopleura dioica TaxID=34765 RepID=A0ABN7T2F1_OIKDI|nr:Oidioi.mRNA.OKI2018_I69.chr2.g6065.t1.cds [Oikopleura dioica]